MKNKLHRLVALSGLLGFLVLPSCATGSSVQSRLPAPVALGKDTGHRAPLLIMVGLRTGEKLPFLLDTGAPVTCLDKSLEPRLGKYFGTVTASNFGVEHQASVYEAPQLFLGNTLLSMTGTNVITFDFTQAPPKGPRPYVGILGMHVLLNYCIQLDFGAHRLRFLPATSTDRKGWGKPFPLTPVGDGCVAITENLVGAKGPGSLVDTGYRGDGFLTPELFQRWTNLAILPPEGETRARNGILKGEVYPEIAYVNPEKLYLGDPPTQFNGIGLYFLSRHLVTFDFPNHTLYLKRTSIFPLQMEKDTKAAAHEVGTLLVRLKGKGQLPGWSRNDTFANRAETVQLPHLDSAIFDQVRKKGDASIYRYEFSRPDYNLPWTLQKAWKTDQDGRIIETYKVPSLSSTPPYPPPNAAPGPAGP